jgi:uncharacterized membrane protein AbrB (regulator of aidB expression)
MIDRERRTWIRFLIIVAAAAAGETIGIWQRLPSADLLLPLLFGGAAYYLTMGLNAPRPRGGGDLRYWRGRRIDDN